MIYMFNKDIFKTYKILYSTMVGKLWHAGQCYYHQIVMKNVSLQAS